VSDLAELLKTSSRTIHRLNSAHLIPSPVRIGCRPRWRREEIEAWLKAGGPKRKEWEQMKG
jgi:predicted DNA-binding transcriptional regulator AlpA